MIPTPSAMTDERAVATVSHPCRPAIADAARHLLGMLAERDAEIVRLGSVVAAMDAELAEAREQVEELRWAQ